MIYFCILNRDFYMKPFLLLITCSILCFSKIYAQQNNEPLSALEEEKLKAAFKKEQRDLAYSISGVGLEFGNPGLGKDVSIDRNWLGVNILHSVFVAGYSQGKVSTNYTEKTDFMPAYIQSGVLNGRKFYIGLNFPLNVGTFGRYISYKNVFRGHPFIQTTVGSTTFTADAYNKKTRLYDLTFTPGYRLRIPYASIDFMVEGRVNLKNGMYEDGFQTFTWNPKVVARIDGLLERMNHRSVSVSATQFSTTYNGSTTRRNSYDNSDGSRTYVTTRTDNYTTTSSPTRVSLIDIGRYVGLGARVSTNGINTDYYSNQGFLYGANLMMRKSKFLMGLNAEMGTIGHGSITTGQADDKNAKRRKLNRTVADARGTFSTFNIMADLGVDFNSLIMGLGGLAVNENNATPFVSTNFGYSFGYSFLGNQQFTNEATAQQFVNRQNEQSKYTNATLNKSGFVRAWFFGTDVGVTSFRVSWYRYRNAPLANNITMSFAWRFLTLRAG